MSFYFVFPADLAFEDLYLNNPVLQICSDLEKKATETNTKSK